MYARLKEPHKCDGGVSVYKVMLYENDEGVYLFEYASPEAIQCSSDRFYDSLEDLYDDWNDLVDERGWIELEDPLPDCQQDAFIPLRVKGREIGKPDWERCETLIDGKWFPYKPV